jgi:hypothetical protein
MLTLSEVLTDASVIVQVNVYTPSTVTETVEFLAAGFENVEVPGPAVCVHIPEPVCGSLALRVMVNPQVDWSNPAFALGAGRSPLLHKEIIGKKINALKSASSLFRIHEKIRSIRICLVSFLT